MSHVTVHFVTLEASNWTLLSKSHRAKRAPYKMFMRMAHALGAKTPLFSPHCGAAVWGALPTTPEASPTSNERRVNFLQLRGLATNALNNILIRVDAGAHIIYHIILDTSSSATTDKALGFKDDTLDTKTLIEFGSAF